MKPAKLLSDVRGMTLVELMVTVGIVCMVMGSVVYLLGGNIAENNLRASARQLESVMKEAKLYAYEKGVTHSLVFNADGRGYKMFRDTDENRVLDSGESVLRIINLNQGVTTSNNAFTANGSGLKAVLFDTRGRPVSAGSVWIQPTKDPTTAIKVIVNMVGSIRSVRCTLQGGTWVCEG